MAANYVPDRGHIVWLDFDPVAGHEQGGHRPALVLSPMKYNQATDLMLCVPITSQIKNYPYEVNIAGKTPNVALADQLTCVDWNSRGAIYKSTATADEIDQVIAKAKTLL